MESLFDIENPLQFTLFLALYSVVFYFSTAGAIYGYLYILKKKKYFPDYQLDKKMFKKEVVLSILNGFGNVAFIVPIHMLISKGHSKLYYDVSEHSWGYLALSLFLCLFVGETFIYWIHRWLHLPFFYKHLHIYHHQFRRINPWTSMAFHPIDAFMQSFPYHLCIFLFPTHIGVYLFCMVIVSFWTFNIHDQVSVVHWKGINNSGHHQVHHWFNNYNLGQYFTFWDRLGGTYRDPDLCMARREIKGPIISYEPRRAYNKKETSRSPEASL